MTDFFGFGDPPSTATIDFDPPSTASIRATGSRDSSEALQPGDRLGRYVIERLLGIGGFGEVFEAIEDYPRRRHVAIKTLKSDIDAKHRRERFMAERDAMVHLDHPNISRLLDSGFTKLGDPYIVMELIRGLPITEYCDRLQLNTIERIRLFEPICNALQYAHSRGVIHLDIKPSNILIEHIGNSPSPKVIDFGVARVTTGTTAETENVPSVKAPLLGTMAYMSPEQAIGSRDCLGTAADVYSLGVVLYEVLTGLLPFDRKQHTPEEFLRALKEVEPLPPSQQLKSAIMGEAGLSKASAAARRRGVNLAELEKTIRGELDWIVMRCLHKDPAARYSSPSELWEDLRRYLNKQPIYAGPQSLSYKCRKAVQRHQQLVMAMSLSATITPVWLFVFLDPIVIVALFALLIGVVVALLLALIDLPRPHLSPSLSVTKLLVPLLFVLLAAFDPAHPPESLSVKEVMLKTALVSPGLVPSGTLTSRSTVELLVSVEHPETVRVGESFVVNATFQLSGDGASNQFLEAILASNAIEVEMHLAGGSVSPDTAMSLTPTRTQLRWSVAASETGLHTAFLAPALTSNGLQAESGLIDTLVMVSRPDDLDFSFHVRPKQFEWARLAILMIGVPLVLGQTMTMVYHLARWLRRVRADRARRAQAEKLLVP